MSIYRHPRKAWQVGMTLCDPETPQKIADQTQVGQLRRSRETNENCHRNKVEMSLHEAGERRDCEMTTVHENTLQEGKQSGAFNLSQDKTESGKRKLTMYLCVARVLVTVSYYT